MAHSQTVPANANITAAPAEPLLLFPLARRAHGAVFAFARLAVLLILVLLVPPRNHPTNTDPLSSSMVRLIIFAPSSGINRSSH